MDYALILLSVLMFGGCFALNDVYRKLRGSSLQISLQFSAVSSLAGLLVLLAAEGFRLEFTPFTLWMALLAAVNGFAFTFCSFQALGRINLSLYSLFSMLGGMVLPFVQGIVCYGEAITPAKVLCFLLITAALLLTVEPGEKTKGGIWYAGIFVLNGMSGVLSKLFASSPLEKTGAAGYSIWIALCSFVISALCLLFFRQKPAGKSTPVSFTVGALNGVLNRVANLLLVVALAQIDASVQYPMVTGGVMIVSTLVCFFGEKKPSKKEVAAVLVAFVGLLTLFVIPMI